MSGQAIVWSRSLCPRCKHQLSWFDLTPLFSWIVLMGRCRYCKKPISKWYPIIELVTVIAFLLLLLVVPYKFFLSYALLFSCLIVSIRTDFEYMLISRFVGLYMVPIAFFLSGAGLLEVSLKNSIAGAIFGYLFPFTFAAVFKWFTGKKGMGEGDFELLALIGAFTGVFGAWTALVVGSIMGSIYAIVCMAFGLMNRSSRMPFGPFLAVGSIMFVLFGGYINYFL